MAYPYQLLDLNDEEKHNRRVLLDRYGVYAQLSALIPILAFQLYRLGIWVYFERSRAKFKYDAVPSSPTLKQQRLSTTGGWTRKWRSIRWWLKGDVIQGYGARGHWVAAGVWMSWLLFLCVHRTGKDYLHVTKRFGVVAASQFPIHYLLALKSLYSPLALAFNASHEQLNPWHRISGRIIYGLLFLHATWYMNFFVQANVLALRLKAPVVIVGITAFALLNLLVTTSLAPVRRWNYRVFFICHLTIGLILPPLLFFHAPALRNYISQAFVVFIFDIVCRKLDTITAFTTITQVPGTSLIKLNIPVPPTKIGRFEKAIGGHVYLQLPGESIPKHLSPHIYNMLYNPFTVAAVSPATNTVSLVLRSLDGPTTKALTSLSQMPKARPPINIEGPLGASSKFPNFAARYDRVLLVAGGVGATFILPLYRSITDHFIAENRSSDRVAMIWSMRSGAEMLWVEDEGQHVVSKDDNIKIFVTGSKNAGLAEHADNLLPLASATTSDDLEMDQLPGDVGEGVEKGRPDLKRIVDETFRLGSGERVAVLVCGPSGMSQALRGEVGKWVDKGKEVWFWEEGFGW